MICLFLFLNEVTWLVCEDAEEGTDCQLDAWMLSGR